MNKYSSVFRLTLLAAAAGSLLAACAADAVIDPDAARVRAELTALESDATLGSRAPLAIHDAETAVSLAQQPQREPAASKHLVYLADRKVQIAKAQAMTTYDEDQRKLLGEQNAKIQLDARTREASAAKKKSGELKEENNQLIAEANSANRRSDELQARTDAATLKNEDLQAQLTALQARQTDRGMVLTLGDVLFASGRSELKGGSTGNLGKLAVFLNQYQDRQVLIEGHTDNVGGTATNLALSQRRAESVRAYLMAQGVAASRLSATGEGENEPVADNSSATGRQQNRRVEVIIQNPPVVGTVKP